jgi:uncharacterized protein YceH (UPF0502 family)
VTQTGHRLDSVELRVLGCLLEKQRTTPEQYPLSLNALRLACNQSTNRDPVVDYGESQVHTAAQRLGQIGWARLASGPGSRTAKYRQLFDEALGLDAAETALLALLFLRGPQTVAELKTRSERLHHFAAGDEVAATLTRLDSRELAHLLPRRPGQREERWTHLLAEGPTEAPAGEAITVEPTSVELTTVEPRLRELELRVSELERALAERGLPD